jgi:hypothetical protein
MCSVLFWMLWENEVRIPVERFTMFLVQNDEKQWWF